MKNTSQTMNQQISDPLLCNPQMNNDNKNNITNIEKYKNLLNLNYS